MEFYVVKKTFDPETKVQMDHTAALIIKFTTEDGHYCLNDYNSVSEKLVSEKLSIQEQQLLQRLMQ